MANMTLTKTPMPEQDPKVRARNFEEVALGYTAEQAMEEAGRCLGCKKPKCVEGCPVNVRIPEFIAKVAEGRLPGRLRNRHLYQRPARPVRPGLPPRRASAKASAFGASRANPWPLAAWSGLWRTGTGSM